VPALVCACEGLFGFGQPVLRSEQRGPLERALSIIALVTAKIHHDGISQSAWPIVRVLSTAARSTPLRQSNRSHACSW
jgi:hypothetical protein